MRVGSSAMRRGIRVVVKITSGEAGSGSSWAPAANVVNVPNIAATIVRTPRWPKDPTVEGSSLYAYGRPTIGRCVLLGALVPAANDGAATSTLPEPRASTARVR